MSAYVVENAAVVTAEGVRQGTVAVVAGCIAAVGTRINLPGARRVDAAGAYLMPGLWDLHLHGAGGIDLATAGPEEVASLCRFLAERGVTGFLASLPPRPEYELMEAISRLAAVGTTEGARLLGVHLEGPFLSHRRAGSLDPAAFLTPRPGLLTKWQRAASGIIRMLTLAPELSGAREIILEARSLGIIVAMGHSNADYEQAQAGVEAGICYVTHFPNALPPWHHRHPGAVGAVLSDPRVVLEFIGDGAHLHPATEDLLFSLRGRDGLVLVSDALPGAGLAESTFFWNGHQAKIQGGAAYLPDGRLAGGGALLDRSVLRLLPRFGPEALLAWSRGNPARVLGEGVPRLRCGEKADFVLLDENGVRGAALGTFTAGCLS